MHLALADAVEPPVYPLQDKQAWFLSLRECWLLTAHRHAPLQELPSLEKVVWPREHPFPVKKHMSNMWVKSTSHYLALGSLWRVLLAPEVSVSLIRSSTESAAQFSLTLSSVLLLLRAPPASLLHAPECVSFETDLGHSSVWKIATWTKPS